VLPIVDEAALLTDLRELIQSARQRIATVANATTTLLYWHLGRRLLAESLQDERAPYGKRILATVSRELTVEFGQAFTLRSLYRAIQFCQCFPDQEIVSTLSTQLSWSHFIDLLPIKDPLARDFYAEMCRIERWDVRTLRRKIGGLLYERTALSKRPEAEQVELLELDAKSIRVAEYLTELPPLPLLRQAIEHAREQAARRLTGSEEQA
jgi:hypothetical protein